MVDQEGGPSDPFDKVRLDDAFVEAASVIEPGHRQREQRARSRARGERRARRRASRRRRLRAVGRVLVPVLIVGVVAAGGVLWVRAVGEVDSVPAQQGQAADATTPGSVQLAGTVYSTGDCVIWDQDDVSGVETRRTDVVDCAEPHLFEVAGSVDVRDRFTATYPTDFEWDVVTEEVCGPMAETILGGPFDPRGRYFPTLIKPVPSSWSMGERIVWCGVGARHEVRPERDDLVAASTGKATAAGQALVHAAGTCLDGDGYTVPCVEPHRFEITGTVDLGPVTATVPPTDDDAAWVALVGDRCRSVGASYAGRQAIDDEGFGYLPLEPGSWSSGRRIVECVAGRWRDGSMIPSTGSVRD